VIPIAAFAGPDQFPVDCEFADGTPRIDNVTVSTNGVGGGPYIPAVDPPGPAPLQIGVAQTITIHALDEDPATTGAQVRVPNPAYCNPTAGPCPVGADTVNKTVWRASGFGDVAGTISLGNLTAALTNITWSDTQINATIPAGTPIGTVGGRQLTVTRAGGGPATRTGVTVQVGLRPGAKVVQVLPDATGNLLASPIQTAINNAQRTDLILVNPGVYNEMVIMSKPVQLQGWGEGSTRINALKQPAEKLSAWRTLVDTLVTTGQVDLLPGQEALFGGIEPPALQNEEGAGVLVLASSIGTNQFDQVNNRGARIDGFTITGADTGGGVVVNGYGYYLDISNNRIVNNQGSFGGGIRVGHPRLTNDLADAPEYTDAQNDFVRVHHNTVNQNGGLGGAGAGISMGTGSDSYRVTENWVCGNFNTGDGGGIGHIGRSDRPNNGSAFPLIENNTVIFNETFNQGLTVTGGGIFIGGGAPLAIGGLSPGAGSVLVNRNLIQGNGAGAGDGGGIRLARVNGQDVADFNNSSNWYGVDLFNNIIVNNVAGLAGGGISLQDAVKVNIVHNTIANNDSLGTAGEAFLPGSPEESTPQPGAGIVTRKHSTALLGTGQAAIGTFSDPRLEDTIVWHNRKFFFHVEGGAGATAGPTVWGLCPDIGGTITGLNCPGGNTVVYDDNAVLGVLGAVLACDSASCITSVSPNPPVFVQEYANGPRNSVVLQPEATIGAPPAFDEGGNFIRPSYGPLSIHVDVNLEAGTQVSDYHLSAATIPQGVNLIPTFPTLATDFDGLTRPVTPDIGADERP
jgi:hypothetical protein